jgi:hypothetical protein
MTKLMWLLGQDMEPTAIASAFDHNFAGEVTV